MAPARRAREGNSGTIVSARQATLQLPTERGKGIRSYSYSYTELQLHRATATQSYSYTELQLHRATATQSEGREFGGGDRARWPQLEAQAQAQAGKFSRSQVVLVFTPLTLWCE